MGGKTITAEVGPDPSSTEERAAARQRRKRSMVIFALVSLVNVGLLGLLWWQLLTPASGQSARGQQTETGFGGPMVGKMAPNFTLPLLAPDHGGSVSLADFRGQAIVLNVWQSSCEPCQREAPVLEAAWLRVEGQGIVFLGLDYQDDHTAALHFLQSQGITYTNVVDASGSTAINYGVANLPTTIFINRQGRIVGWHEGELTPQTLAAGLQLLNR
jgi:cytochrome c biogenesis protein CcmG/thiol:disulfide interchange protein DsbE